MGCLSLEYMLKKIASMNGITKFNFLKYVPSLTHGHYGFKASEGIGTLFEVETKRLSRGISKIASNCGRKRDCALGIASKVIARGKERHLLLLDFDIHRLATYSLPSLVEDYFGKLAKNKRLNDALAVGEINQVINRLKGGGDGFIVKSSDRGYHFYGLSVITDEERRETLRDCSRIEEQWAESQLQIGYSILRISACKNRLYAPKVIACPDYV